MADVSCLDLSDNVFRWTPLRPEEFGGIHAVNEGVLMKSHMDVVKFYYNLIRVMSNDVEASHPRKSHKFRIQ